MASETVFKREGNPSVAYTAVFSTIYLVHCCRVCPSLLLKYIWMTVVAPQNLCMRLMRIYYIRHDAFLKNHFNIHIYANHLFIPLQGCLWLELAFIHGLNPVYLIAMAV